MFKLTFKFINKNKNYLHRHFKRLGLNINLCLGDNLKKDSNYNLLFIK